MLRQTIIFVELVLAVLLCSSCAVDRYYLTYDSAEYRPKPKVAVVHTISDKDRMLHAWYVPARSPAKGTIVHFHGNGKNLTFHYLYSKWFREAGYNLFIFDYRGFGRSSGQATLSGMIEDGAAVMRYIKQLPDSEHVVVFAQSMGTVPAILALAEGDNPRVKGLILDSPISSLKRLGYEHLKGMGYTWPIYFWPLIAVPSEYTTLSAMDEIGDIPVIIFHGTADHVIDPSHSKKLAKKAPTLHSLHLLKDVGHVDAFSYHLSVTRPIILDFLSTVLAPTPAP